MRPVLKVSLILLVLFVLFLGYATVRGIRLLKIHHHDAVPMMIENGCLNYFMEYNRLPPSSDNQKLTAALLGDNSRHIAFLALSKDRLSSDNEAVDSWGTPYRINFQGNSGVQIISAGPDKTFGTPDDIVTNGLDEKQGLNH